MYAANLDEEKGIVVLSKHYSLPLNGDINVLHIHKGSMLPPSITNQRNSEPSIECRCCEEHILR